MIDPRVFAVAEIRHAELLEHAAQNRLARRAVGPHGGSRRWSHVLRDAVLALRARGTATRRSHLTTPIDLAAVVETG